ncbi:valine--tRNA ligase [Cereibacter changlensis JA139]|uniref:Valine--tRNA ligase n=4 Tax=Cereibacter changlensis TaxID=402884 RepID=A0A2T4JWF1_9RHOB|nr:valine--tRNA ligase [Cereibacter changlensis JA139]PZX53021.1 valyl-tRNA synthetase [Cereibacter changlensis]
MMEKTFNAAEAEARLYAAWEEAGAFKAGANASRPETFCIMIPPPNVTGSLHMGHAFNNTLQDILTRWHRMRGFDTLWQPGQDHAGIATQMVVERELAKSQLPSRRELGREAFLEKVWEWKEQSGGTIINQLKRLGASCDWSRNAFTMDANFQQAVIKVFVDLYDKGLIYRGKRLVNWDPHFETAISDLEVENIEVAGHMWHFKYPLAGGETYTYVEKDAEGNITLSEERDYISIATTRPETMLGDGAVAVHPSDERYAPIVGKLCEIPVGPKGERRLIPIITDEYPDPAFGSGAVKITGAHDFNDYGVAMRHGIPLYPLMDTKGVMRRDDAEDNMVPDRYRGLDRFACRTQVIEDITAEGLAVMIEDAEGNLVPYVEAKKIMQPFGDRSKVVIEPMLTDQWFVDTAKIVQPAIDAVRNGDTEILPERDAKVYFHWLENIEPWCISRQLWWGHQIPVWYGLDIWPTGFRDDEGDQALDEVEIFRLLSDGAFNHAGPVHHCAADLAGVEAKFLDDVAALPAPLNHARIVEVADRAEAIDRLAESLAQYNLSQDPTQLVYPVWRDPDVLDTWFSSGLWPIGTLGWPEATPELERYFPTNVLITGFDIIFFWVARMMMMQLAVVDQVPFKTVYVHALVRDEKGKKMSKSLGNVLDPLELIDDYGADAVRFTVTAMAAMGRDLKLSTARIAGYRNFGTKLWNACRFAEMNGVWEGHATGPAPAAQATVNRWIIGETGRVREEVDAALAAYRFDAAANALYAFVWGKVCDWYVEFAKPLFDGDQAAETRATMGWVLDQCMILLHPIMPFVTEELWATTGTRAKMLVHTDWPTYGAELVDQAADREMTWVIGLIDEIRSARAQMHVPAGLKLDMLQLSLDEAGRGAWARNEALIKRLARLESLTEAAMMPKGALTVAVEGGSFAIPLEGIIDIAEEKARLSKTLEKLEKDMGGLRGRLNNPNFVASAKEEVVEETREKLEQGEAEAVKLRAALVRLAEVG